jgi:monoamine oxidase
VNTIDTPTVAIIGAGLAGLTAAYRLFQKGVKADVYEARGRVGGRVLSALVKNYLGDYSIVELGGQNITDGGEAANFIGLAKDLGLNIASNEICLPALFHYQGSYLNIDENMWDYMAKVPDFNSKIDLLALQCLTIEDIINQLFPDNEILQAYISTRMSAYEGISVKYQSIHHNLDTLKCMLEGGLAPAHEFYEAEQDHLVVKSISDGNAQLPLAIENILGPQLHLNKPLVKIAKIDNKFILSFQDKTTAIYDTVIIATPASTYQNISMDENILAPVRWKKMQSVAYGGNYKVICPFNLTELESHRCIISDSQLSFFNHDQNVVVLYANRPINPSEMKNEFEILRKGYNLQESLDSGIIQTAKDINSLYYTKPITYSWLDAPYSKGSYSGYSTVLSTELDQKIVYEGEEFKELFQPTSDNLFFIGEHTTILDVVGTLEAAVESGERIARVWCKRVFGN